MAAHYSPKQIKKLLKDSTLCREATPYTNYDAPDDNTDGDDANPRDDTRCANAYVLASLYRVHCKCKEM